MKKKNKSFYIILIVLVLFGVSIGYSAINRTFNITGNSEVKENTWDLHFENVRVKKGSVTAIKEPTIDNSKLSIDFSTVLNVPGDFYEFSIDVVNAGSIDEMIDSVVKTPELSDAQKKYLHYTIEYQNGEDIKVKQLVSNNSFIMLKVRVEYRTDITASDLPTITENLNLGFTLNYVQADSTGITINNNGFIGADGDINEIGTIVTIGSDEFYTIGVEGDNVKLLSMYNLYVGGDYSSSWLAYGDNATGMQDGNMLGDLSNQSVSKGTTYFSSAEQHGTNYNDYNGSVLEEYVNNYKSLLASKFKVTIVDARLITYDELSDVNSFGCVNWDYCSNKYSWIYSTSYWVGTAIYEGDLWTVKSDGKFSNHHYSNVNSFGVRPVILIPKSYF